MKYAELQKLYHRMIHCRGRKESELTIEAFLTEVEKLEEAELDNFYKQAEARATALNGPTDQGE